MSVKKVKKKKSDEYIAYIMIVVLVVLSLSALLSILNSKVDTAVHIELATPEPQSTSEVNFSVNIPILPFATRSPESAGSDSVIYLTFDDGPSTDVTEQILDILKARNIKATFFILDYPYGSEKEQLVIRQIQEGHTVGLHGISHDYSEIYTDLNTLMSNFTILQEKVYISTGYHSTLIRFPGGSSNTISRKYCPGIMTKAVNYLPSTEFVYFDWNIDSNDTGYANSARDIYYLVTDQIKQHRSNVVLMHDTNQYTAEALNYIIDYGLKNGYTFKALTPETTQVTHIVAN